MKRQFAFLAPVFLALVLFFASPLPVLAAGNAGSIGIAAIVNDSVITRTDVSNRLQLYIAGNPKAPPPEVRQKMEQQILNKLIDEKLQLQEAKSLGVAVDEQQVSDGFAKIAQQNNLPPDEFKKRLASGGVKIDTLYDQIRAEIAWGQVVRRKLRPQLSITEGEIDRALSEAERMSGKTEYRVAEIFLTVDESHKEGDVRREAEKVVAHITKGASFSSVAREVSQAPGAAQGGDLGWISEGQLDQALETALGKMQPGQISPPVRTDKGFHVLFLRDIRKGEYVPSEGAAVAAVAVASGPALHLKQIVIPVAVTDPAPVVNAKMVRAQSLKSEIPNCAAMDTKMQDFATPGTGDLGSVPESALSEPVKAAVAGLETGVLSSPLRTSEGVIVFMVCGRSEAGGTASSSAGAPPVQAAPAPETTREKIASKIGMQRLDQMQERYLRDLRATAFIDKRI